MSAIGLTIRRIIGWLWRLLPARWLYVYQIELVDELPDALRPWTVYCLGGDRPWCAVLQCPCNCGAAIHLSLLRDEKPSWRLTTTGAGVPTLAPSIWRTDGCESHFWIKRGRVVWH